MNWAQDGNPNSIKYGNLFWIVQLHPDGWLSLCADEIKVEDGHLVAYCHNKSGEKFIGLCLAPVTWSNYFAASMIDGCPIVVDTIYIPDQKSNEKNGRIRISTRIRKLLMDKAGNKCVKCGRSESDGVKLHVDHIIPLAMGGTNSLDNLQPLCVSCNSSKNIKGVDYRNTVHPE